MYTYMVCVWYVFVMWWGWYVYMYDVCVCYVWWVVSVLYVCACMKLRLILEKAERVMVRAQAGKRVGPVRTGTKSLRFLEEPRPQEPQIRGVEPLDASARPEDTSI